jgi:hypothetical protein
MMPYREIRNSLRVLATASLALCIGFAIGAESQAQPFKGIVNGATGVVDDIGQGIAKGIDINPGIVKNSPVMGVLPPPPKSIPSAPFGKIPANPADIPNLPKNPVIGKLPPLPPGLATPTPPPRPVTALPTTGPNRPLPAIMPEPDAPKINYSGLGPDNAPTRAPRPEKTTGLDGLVGHEPNPKGVPIPVKVNPNAPVKLPGTPIAKTTPTTPKVALPNTPVKSVTPIGTPTLGPPPPALLALYGEDVASQQMRQFKRASQIRKAAIVTAGVGTVALVALVGGGVYLGVTCAVKDLNEGCPEFMRPDQSQQ